MRFTVEELFERWGLWVAGHARSVIAAVLVLTAALGSGVAKLELDTTSRGFLHEDDPIQRIYEAYRAEFGRDVDILVVLEPQGGFSLGFLDTLAELHDAILREVPQLESVASLANAPVLETRAAPGAESLRDLWPRRAVDITDFVQELRANDLYRNRLISQDGPLTTIVLKTQAYTAGGATSDDEHGSPRTDFITGEEDAAIVAALESVVDRYEVPGLDIHVVGGPVFAVELQRSMRRDMVVFTILALATISVLLLALFRRAAGVVLPLAVVSLSVVATLGTMALAGTPIRVPTQVLPSFLLAVGVCGSVHLLVIFFRHYDQGEETGGAIARALSHSGLAILLTALTTAAGLVSFVSAEIAPIGEFGWYGAIGVLVCLLYTLGLLPAALAASPPRRLPPRDLRTEGAPTERGLLAVGRAAIRRPRAAVALAVLLVGAAGTGIARIEFSHDPLQWLPASSDTRRSTELVDETFHGTMSLEILVHAGREMGILEPDLLRRIDRLEARLRTLEIGDARVGQVVSGIDVLKARAQAAGTGGSEAGFGLLPLFNELARLRASNGGELSDWLGSDRSTARVSVRVPWMDAVHYPSLISAVEREAREALGGAARWEVTGATAVMSQTIDAVIKSLVRSYLLALALITPLMVLMIGNLRQGLISMVPNLGPIVITLGIMGWAGIPMDVFTLLVACIAIGLAVDDTIHFMHVFRSAYLRSGDAREAVGYTLRTTGRALLFTTLVLAVGFSVYTASSMENLRNFGGLVALAISLAFLANVFLAPALLELIYGSARGKTPSIPAGAKPAAPLEGEALIEKLRESAESTGCRPTWLRRGAPPEFRTHEVGEHGPHLILIHGLFGAMSNWDEALPGLARFSRVSALRLGLLEWDRTETTVHALALYVEGFLRSRGIARAVLCGNSLGGHVALRVALNAPELVSGLVLTGSSGLYEHEPASMPVRPGEEFVREQMARVFYSDRWITDEGVREMTAIFAKRRDFLAVIRAARSAKRDNLQNDLPRITAPALLFWGEEDQVTPLDVARTFESLMPNAELVTVPRCGHAPMIEAAEDFAEAVRRFVSRLDPQRAPARA